MAIAWRSGADAAHEDLLVAALRHARRPLRRRLDGHSCALTEGAWSREPQNLSQV
jgi:hypothetical protein